MRITDIALRDFRNYASLRLTLSPGLNVFYGENAQGKTGLLEAVHLCCLGRSHRTIHDGVLIREGQPTAYASVRAARADGPRHVEVLLSRSEKKRVLVSGAAIRRMAELMGHVRCIMFSPEDLWLIKGSPSARRRFMDTSLCQLRPAYFQTLQRYNALMLMRNALLKQPRFDTAQMDAYEQMLSEAGADIIAQRKSFLGALAPLASGVYQSIAPHERLTLQYKTQLGEGEGVEALRALYLRHRADDVRRMRTCVGPHRDDLVLCIDGADARPYGSQGQQRTAALSLKLASVAQIKAEAGQAPVLMLDDVFSELDEPRQQALLAHLGGQTLLTTATTPPAMLRDGRRFTVKQGQVRAE
jgi:DNA replication and repair protein RecF